MAPKNNKRYLRKKSFMKKSSKNSNPEKFLLLTNMLTDVNDGSENVTTERSITLEPRVTLAPKKGKSSKVDKKTNIEPEPLNVDMAKKSKITILGEVTELMKCDSPNDEFKLALVNMFKILDVEKSRKKQIYSILLAFSDNLINCTVEDLTLTAEKCFELLLPKELLSIVTKENDKIEEFEMIGSGGFGKVTRGRFCPVNGPKKDVAIKSHINKGHAGLFKTEAVILSQLNHPNIVKILAFQKNPTLLVLELMQDKNLTEYLLFNRLISRKQAIGSNFTYYNLEGGRQDLHYIQYSETLTVTFFIDISGYFCMLKIHTLNKNAYGNMNRPTHTVSEQCLYDWMLQILSGLEYISEKNIVHRDLATRNIFMNSQMECKIGDFGLSCYAGYTDGIYTNKDGSYLAAYNISPESRATQMFTTKSDVWAFGILMWEMFFLNNTYFIMPYLLNVELNRFQLFQRLSKPPGCPTLLFHLIIGEIMEDDPQLRPTFTVIKEIINNHNNWPEDYY